MKLGFVFITLAVLAGCSSLSGYDAKTSFACRAPDGVLCESMSGIYANAMQKNLPGQRMNSRKQADKTSTFAQDGVFTQPIDSGMPVRSPPRVLRVWFAPWEDRNNDLHDQSYVYLTVDVGHWLIEHNRRRIEDTYRPVHAPTHSAESQPNSNPVISDPLPANPVQTSDGEDLIGIGIRQDRPSDEHAEDMLDGIQKPGDLSNTTGQ